MKIMALAAGGGTSEIVQLPNVEHHPPDVAAIRYFFNNRDPAEWRERTPSPDLAGEVVIRLEGGLPRDETGTITLPRSA